MEKIKTIFGLEIEVEYSGLDLDLGVVYIDKVTCNGIEIDNIVEGFNLYEDITELLFEKLSKKY